MSQGPREGNDDDAILRAEGRAIQRHAVGTGRVGTYSVIGAASNALPLPWVPDLVTRRIRGALAHDVASRFGLSLLPEAREIFAEPSNGEGPRGFVAQTIRFVSGKVLTRLGPLGFFPPVRSGFEVFLLGHLLERYFETVRTDPAIRIDVDEARTVRRAIDSAILRAITLDATPLRDTSEFSPEDLRDTTTKLIDGVLIAVASVPGWLVKRVEAAFDETLLSLNR